MFASILTVCDGNICRSPTAAALLQQHLPDRLIGSAGLVALVDHGMAPLAREVALEHGVDAGQHSARRLDSALCRDHDLILVMEQRQRDEVMRRYPTVSGKVFLLSHWNGGRDIPDPWQRDREVYQAVFKLLHQACAAWLPKLA